MTTTTVPEVHLPWVDSPWTLGPPTILPLIDDPGAQVAGRLIPPTGGSPHAAVLALAIVAAGVCYWASPIATDGNQPCRRWGSAAVIQLAIASTGRSPIETSRVEASVVTSASRSFPGGPVTIWSALRSISAS